MNIKKLLKINNEQKTLHSFLNKFVKKDCRILDVGCGYGRNIKFLQKLGYKVTGVEVNNNVVENMKSQGYNVFNVKEFKETNQSYDVILMSHFIEHFQPDELLDVLKNYLNYLVDGGVLIISTPYFTKDFYVDFDHVKPYHPSGIEAVFSANQKQVQFSEQQVIRIIDFRFVTSLLKLTYTRSVILGKISYFEMGINIVMGILYLISFGYISKKVGWIGAFKKE